MFFFGLFIISVALFPSFLSLDLLYKSPSTKKRIHNALLCSVSYTQTQKPAKHFDDCVVIQPRAESLLRQCRRIPAAPFGGVVRNLFTVYYAARFTIEYHANIKC